MKQADAKGVLDHQRELALDHLALAVLGLSIRDQQNPEEYSLRLAATKRLLSRLKAKE